MYLWPMQLNITRLPHRRGAAMTEMVLAMPFLVVVLALMIYFGREMVRIQRTLVLDRYTTWQSVATSATGASQVREDVSGMDAQTQQALNNLYFGGHASDIDRHSQHVYPGQATEQFLFETLAYSTSAHDYAQQLVLELPDGLSHRYKVQYDQTVPYYKRFQGPIRHGHIRLAYPWDFANGLRSVPQGRGPYGQVETSDDASSSSFSSAPDWQAWSSHGRWHYRDAGAVPWPIARDVFFEQFDRLLAMDDDQPRDMGTSNPLDRMTSDLYLASPGYLGPAYQLK